MSFGAGIVGGLLTLCLYYVGLFVLGKLGVYLFTICLTTYIYIYIFHLVFASGPDQFLSDRRGADFPGGVHWCVTKEVARVLIF